MPTPSFFMKIPYTLVGPGSINRLNELITEFNAHSTIIITDQGIKGAGLIKKITAVLKNTDCKYSVFDGCEPNAPSGTIDKCTQQAVNEQPDVLIAVGGGSVIDTAKVVSVTAANNIMLKDLIGKPNLPPKVLRKIMVPTTSGTGSEWSRLALLYDEADGQKKALRGMNLFPDAVVVDPELTLGMPPKVTADTGVDALTHGIEAYTSITAHPIGDIFAETVIKLVSANLLRAFSNGNDIEARYNLSIAASFGMAALTIDGGGLAHMIDGSIISKAHISHGAALAIITPHVMEFNLPSHTEKYAKLATLMGAKISGLSLDNAAKLSVETYKKLCKDLGMKQRLRDIGITKDDLSLIATNVAKLAGPRLAPFKLEDVTKILNAAL
ncbi:iron-containing alcohol dehydrogenase [Chloroflexota bacterium]